MSSTSQLVTCLHAIGILGEHGRCCENYQSRLRAAPLTVARVRGWSKHRLVLHTSQHGHSTRLLRTRITKSVFCCADQAFTSAQRARGSGISAYNKPLSPSTQSRKMAPLEQQEERNRASPRQRERRSLRSVEHRNSRASCSRAC